MMTNIVLCFIIPATLDRTRCWLRNMRASEQIGTDKRIWLRRC
jgi:hypothetical protein